MQRELVGAIRISKAVTVQEVKAKRAFLSAFDRTGDVGEALAACNLAPETHLAWLADPTYRGAYEAIVRDHRAGKTQPDRKPRSPVDPPGTVRRIPAPPVPATPKPGKRRGRPPKPLGPDIGAPEPKPAPPVDPTPPETPKAEPLEPVAPVIREEVYEGNRGHVRMYIREGQEPAPPDEPEPAPKPKAPEYEPEIEVSLTSNSDQRRIVDEYGELDRRMQLRAMDAARYDVLKRAIKSWFDQAPADADGTVDGEFYLLHLSARERERKVRNLRQVIEIIGLDKFLELVVLPIGRLEDLLGVAHVAELTVDERTGSRRIKAIAKRAIERRANERLHEGTV